MTTIDGPSGLTKEEKEEEEVNSHRHVLLDDMSSVTEKEEEEEEEKCVHIIFNHSREPWIKYNMSSVTKRAPTLLKDEEVLYLEDWSHRYKLCCTREKLGSTPQERVSVFRFARCKRIFDQKMMLRRGVPLPVYLLEDVRDGLEWKDLRWLDTGVVVGGTEYKLVRMLYLTPTGVGSNTDSEYYNAYLKS